jgi:hypothetical protein
MANRMIFCPTMKCNRPYIDELLREVNLEYLSDRSRHYLHKAVNIIEDTSSFSAYLILNGRMAGFAIGKYARKPFETVSSFELLWDSVLTWIEIFPQSQGRGVCFEFVKFIFEELQDRGVLFVEINNVGGIPGCRCYLRSVRDLQGIGGHYDILRQLFDPFSLDQCSEEYENINMIIFYTAKDYYPQFFTR